MAITTVDVVTNVVSGVETIRNGSCTVYCFNTGSYQSLASSFQGSFTYSNLESKYTNRFDDIGYYQGVDGGAP